MGYYWITDLGTGRLVGGFSGESPAEAFEAMIKAGASDGVIEDYRIEAGEPLFRSGSLTRLSRTRFCFMLTRPAILVAALVSTLCWSRQVAISPCTMMKARSSEALSRNLRSWGVPAALV